MEWKTGENGEVYEEGEKKEVMNKGLENLRGWRVNG